MIKLVLAFFQFFHRYNIQDDETAGNVYCNNIHRFKSIKKYLPFLGGRGVGYHLRPVDVQTNPIKVT